MKSIFAFVAALATAVFALAGAKILANQLVLSGTLAGNGTGYFLMTLCGYLLAGLLGFLIIRLVAGSNGAKPGLLLSAAIIAFAVKSMTVQFHPGWFPAALLASLWMSWWLVFSRAEPASAMLRRQAGEPSTHPSPLRRAGGRR